MISGNSIKYQIKNLDTIMERKRNEIEIGIADRALPSLQRAIYLESLINLTQYSATGSAPRDSRITDAFDLLADLVGFEYNDKGSFTWTGARDALKKDVKPSSSKLSVSFSLEGKLEELEDGRTNWKNLKRFFYSHGIKTRIKILYPGQWKNIYSRLDSLFKTKKDPTMPDGRPYISAAMETGADYLHTYIKDIVHQSFNRKGRWRDVLGRYA